MLVLHFFQPSSQSSPKSRQKTWQQIAMTWGFLQRPMPWLFSVASGEGMRFSWRHTVNGAYAHIDTLQLCVSFVPAQFTSIYHEIRSFHMDDNPSPAFGNSLNLITRFFFQCIPGNPLPVGNLSHFVCVTNVFLGFLPSCSRTSPWYGSNMSEWISLFSLGLDNTQFNELWNKWCSRPLVGRWMFCSKVVAWVCFTHFHTMFNGPFKWENTSNGRKERIEWYMNRYVCIQLINCIHAYIYIHIFAFMFLYTHIFALTINTHRVSLLFHWQKDFQASTMPTVYPQSLSPKFH